jgi:hypothetical protein
VSGRIADPSGGAVVAAIDLTIAIVADQAAVRSPCARTHGGRDSRDARIDRPSVEDDDQSAPCAGVGSAGVGSAALASGVPAAITATVAGRNIRLSAGSIRQSRENQQAANQEPCPVG